MRYWNQESFEGLKAIGEAYSSISGYEDFSEYCLLREKGLRKQSLDAIERFLKHLDGMSEELKRQIVIELSCLTYNNRNVHHLMTHTLRQFIIGVLEPWAKASTCDAAPHRWFAYISGDYHHYELALEIEPEDQVSINRLALRHIDEIDYQTHHLGESFMIGDLVDAKTELKKARDLIAKLKSAKIRKLLDQEASYYSSLLKTWEEYGSEDRTKKFPEWCEEFHKGKFRFLNAIYY